MGTLTPSPTREVVTVTDHRWRSTLTLTARAEGDPAAESYLQMVLSTEAHRLEMAASRFRADSEVSAVNAGAGAWTDVSWYFVTVLTAALDAAAATDGLVNPCMGALVDAAGYRVWRDGAPWRPSRPVEQGTDAYRSIEIRPAGTRAKVRIPQGCQLDLGAVAKAWLADRIAQRVADHLDWDVVANLGGDLRAVGRHGAWTLGADAEVPGMTTTGLEVGDAGLATSGRGRRAWTTPQGSAHHIIDPRTGKPASTLWWSATVLAGTAAGANTAATAAMILDQAAEPWLAERGLHALLVAWEPGGGSPRRTLVGQWPEGTPEGTSQSTAESTADSIEEKRR